MRPWTAPALAVLALVLAGCSGAPADGPTGTASLDLDPNRMTIGGLVQSPSFTGLPGASVRLIGTNLTQSTDGLGLFRFPPVEPRAYPVEVRLAGYRTQIIVAQPGTNERSLDFVLQPDLPTDPFQRYQHARGLMECGFQAVAEGGSCDDPLITILGEPALANQTTLPFLMLPRWSTLVLDIVFDAEATPAMDGLSVGLEARRPGADALDAGRSGASTSFTIRLDAGQEVPGGKLTGNETTLLASVRPRGFAESELCSTGQAAGLCPAGVGAAANIEFDLYLTAFYVKPAPAGFSLRPDAA